MQTWCLNAQTLVSFRCDLFFYMTFSKLSLTGKSVNDVNEDLDSIEFTDK